MGATTGIEWTDSTWNPWHGCIKVSPGCKHCYMYRDKTRYGQDPKAIVKSSYSTFCSSLRWTQPQKVFTCSWSDFFIEQADPWRADAWDIIRQTPHLTYQILTKRPENIASRLPADWGNGWPNVWLGVSVENQQYADERIPHLLQTPAAVRFLSCEPLLGPIDLTGKTVDGVWIDPDYAKLDPHLADIVEREGWWINWVIVGGESGPDARPMKPEWARSLRDQCQAANVPFFFKQWGGVNKKAAGRLLDGVEWSQFPQEIKV